MKLNVSNRVIAFGVISIIAASVVTGVYLTGLSNTTESAHVFVTTTCMGSCATSMTNISSATSSTFGTTNSSATFCISSGESTPHNCTAIETSENTTVTPTIPTAVNYQNGILVINRAFQYNEIPYNFTLGNFTIRLVNNGTGYETPPVNETSRAITAFVFAFDITTPDSKTTNSYFIWWPPCNTNLGLPCQTQNNWVLPYPENSTTNYYAASLVILWYTNSTGFYVTFQQWEEGQTAPPMTTSNSTLPPNFNLTTTVVSNVSTVTQSTTIESTSK